MDFWSKLTKNQKHLVVFFSIAIVTTILGFFAWWTLPLVPFAAAGLLIQINYGFVKDILLLTSVGPAFSWVMTAFVRDASEGFRISPKLAGLLHLGPAAFVYICLFCVALVVSAFAAWSGAETSKALR